MYAIVDIQYKKFVKDIKINIDGNTKVDVNVRRILEKEDIITFDNDERAYLVAEFLAKLKYINSYFNKKLKKEEVYKHFKVVKIKFSAITIESEDC